jgi:diaminohydroxyphosphoribosylaminopyrimidine deaminase/5-amino-6-(5-phosphoribosylamino)uracil reductase
LEQEQWSEEDRKYMALALELAKKGRGYTNPNPMVGAVIVRDGRILGQGYHERCGEGHAEVNAFRNATEDVTGADMYVTLEPCSHYGKTPPCADLIIRKKIRRVVVAMTDPHDVVSGRGLRKLQDAGILVEMGLYEAESRRLNEVFVKYIVQKEPFVVLKTAMTLDGKIATRTGKSQWISGEKSRAQVQELRHAYKGILVGVQTVIADNPRLTCRKDGGLNPVRIVCDSHLRIPLDCNLLTDKAAPTIVATTNQADADKLRQVEQSATVLVLPQDENHQVSIPDLMKELGKLEIDSVLLEGGSTLAYSFLAAGCVDKVVSYIAPKIFGGVDAKTPVGGLGVDDVEDAIQLTDISLDRIGEDIVVTGYPVKVK